MKENNWCVYMHTNKSNGKKYIGISKNPQARWGSNGHRYKKQYFGDAIKKYGWDGFVHEILFSGLSEHDACEKEIQLISKYKTCNSKYGYNILPGGDVGSPLPPGTYSKNCKPVYQYSLDGSYIKKFNSIKEASSIHGTGISGCINNKSYTSDNYQWFDRYMGKKVASRLSRVDAIIESQNTNVYQYSSDGRFVGKYTSINDAANAAKIDRSGISNCINGIAKTAGGYVWYREYKGKSITPFKVYYNKPKAIFKYSLDGKFLEKFNSQRDASSTINHRVRLKNRIEKHFGYIWSYDYFPLGLKMPQMEVICEKD